MWTQKGQGSTGKASAPLARNLRTYLNSVVINGYTESFKVTARGLYAVSKGRYYRPEQVRIINFYNFEGNVNPDDNAMMYVIETSDGLRGTIVHPATYPDETTQRFITDVEAIRMKMERFNQHEC